MKYTTVYDYYSTLASQRYYILFLCISVILLVLCTMKVKKIYIDEFYNTDTKVNVEEPVFICLMFFLILSVAAFSLILTRPSAEAISKNNFRVVSGKVSYFYPASYLGSTSGNYAIIKADSERFYVDDTYFKYDTLHFWYPGYRKTYYRGGYIRSNGQNIRVTYYYDIKKMENVIIKLEVADS